MPTKTLLEYYYPAAPPEPLGDLFNEMCIPDRWRQEPLPWFLEGIVFEREPISAQVRQRVMERDGWACRWCGSREQLQIDHILPVSAGGGSHPLNLRTLCARCNRRRGNRQSDRHSAVVLPIVARCCWCTDAPSGALERPTPAYCTTCGAGSLAEKSDCIRPRREEDA